MASTDRPQVNKEPFIEDKCEQLFLLEVLVDKIKIKTEGLLGSIEPKEEVVEEVEEEEEADEDEDEEEAKRRREEARRKKRKKPITRPIKVKVRFFDFPTIEIDEWDFTEAKEARQVKIDMLKEEEDEETEEMKAEDLGLSLEEYQEQKRQKKLDLADELANTLPPGEKFCSGKSCLFPIIPMDLVKAIQKTPLNVQVDRAGDAMQGPRVIGRTNIKLGDNFVEAIALASTPTILPVSAFIDGPYEVKNVFGEVTAIVDLYVRISCFGNSIFTQFKLKEGEEDYLFKMSGSNLSDLERLNKMNKGKEFNPILNPIFTQLEDFSVGIKAPVVQPNEPNLKLPVSWRKPYDFPKQIPVCPPKKLYGKPRPKVKYRKKIYKDLDLLQEVIPGFGRQLGDPEFINENPTIPRYADENDADDEINIIKPKEDQFKNAENPGITLPCQYGTSWSPLQFPLRTVPRYPPLDEVQTMALENLRRCLLPSVKEANLLAKKRLSEIQALYDDKKPLKCTCNTLERGLTQLPFSCSCDETMPAYKFRREFEILPKPIKEEKEIPTEEENKILNERIKECIKQRFQIVENIGRYDQDAIVMTARVEYDINDSDQYTTLNSDDRSPSSIDINLRLIEKFKSRPKFFSDKCSSKNNSSNETFGTKGIIGRHRMASRFSSKSATLKNRPTKGRYRSVIDDSCKCTNKAKPGTKQGVTKTQMKQPFDDFTEDELDEQLLEKKAFKDAKLLERLQKEKEFTKLMEDVVEKKRKACGKKKFLLKKIEERRLLKQMEEEANKAIEAKKGEDTDSQKLEDADLKSESQEVASTAGDTPSKTKEPPTVKKGDEGKPSIKLFKNLIKLRGKLYEEAQKNSEVKKLQDECAKERHICIKYKKTDGMYPGMKFGHETCREDFIKCPAQFGWMWDYCSEKMKRKQLDWKPDLSRFRVARVETKPEDKPKTKIGPRQPTSDQESSISETIAPDGGFGIDQFPDDDPGEVYKRYKSLQAGEIPIEPTLHIHKTEGKYYAMLFPQPNPLFPQKFNREDVVLFKFDPNHPNESSDTGKGDTDDSTISGDSYALDVTCPLGVSKYVPPTLFHSLASQTIESYAIRPKTTLGSGSTGTFESSEVDINIEEIDPEKVKQICQPTSTTSSSSETKRKGKKKGDTSTNTSDTASGKKKPAAKGMKGQQVAVYTATLHQTSSPFTNTDDADNIEETSSDRASTTTPIQTIDKETEISSSNSSAMSRRKFGHRGNKKVTILEPIAEIYQTLHDPPPLTKVPKTKILKSVSKY